jgi:hypothetical protein
MIIRNGFVALSASLAGLLLLLLTFLDRVSESSLLVVAHSLLRVLLSLEQILLAKSNFATN